MVPKTRSFSKKILKFLFSGSEKPLKNATLRANFLTDNFIKEVLNIEIQKYNSIHNFNFEQTNAIINHFQLTENEIKEAREHQRAYKQKK